MIVDCFHSLAQLLIFKKYLNYFVKNIFKCINYFYLLLKPLKQLTLDSKKRFISHEMLKNHTPGCLKNFEKKLLYAKLISSPEKILDIFFYFILLYFILAPLIKQLKKIFNT